MSTVDLAVIGNGMFGALLDNRGRFVWCCLDTFDGDPVFNCLVNNNSEQTGFYDVVLEGCERSEQKYLDTSSALLVTTLHTGQGDSVEIRDFAPRFMHFDRIFRPFQIFRTVKRLKGDPRVAIRIRPTFQYNSTDGYQTRGSQHVRFCGPTHTWRVTTTTSIRHVLEEMYFLLTDEPVYIVFGTDESFANSLRNVATDFETKTVQYWKQWCNSMCLPVEYQEVIVRAAMTVAIIQSEDCGGFLSALTMDLPLGPLGEPTRDTRVCRLLDECLALPVLRDVGLFDVCRKFLLFAKEACFKQESPQHTYTPWGNTKSKPRELAPYLAGYRGMGEVHSGGPFPDMAVGEDTGSATDGAKVGSSLANGESTSADPAQQDVAEISAQTVVYSLLVVALAHAFFDIRLSHELCTPKLFEKLESYALHACDNISEVAQQFRRQRGEQPENGEADASKRGTSSSASVSGGKTHRPPAGAGFFDDDPRFLMWQQEVTPAEEAPDQQDQGAPKQPAVHSLTSVLCWAAADRLHRVSAHFLSDRKKAEYWQQRAAEMHEEICRFAWSSQRGAFTTYWGGDSVGPSVLRVAELGFLPAEDERFRGTVRAFEVDALGHSVCFGSDLDALPPGLQGSSRAGSHATTEESAISAQSACFMTNTLLWYCEALRSTGSPLESKRLLEALLRCSRHRGLLSESVDLKAAELWGNMPSVTALLSLLRVAPRLSRSWREV